MTAALAPLPAPQAIERALIDGDLSSLSVEQRGVYYQQVCQSLGLNPLTQPFGYLVLNNKLRLYALKGCTDQLRAQRQISIELLSMTVEQDLFMVHVRAKDQTGRVDEDVGFAVIATLKGEALGNAKLKAITKAKRRVSLSICGLGMLDETEVASIPEARTYTVAMVPDVPVPQDTSPTGESDPAPAPQHPTVEQVDHLFALAASCREPKDLLGRRLREVMGLSGEVRISKKFLAATMTEAQYTVALAYYERLLTQIVEAAVPTTFPPAGVSDGRTTENTPMAEPAAAPSGEDSAMDPPPGAYPDASSSAPAAAAGSTAADAAAKAQLKREAISWGIQDLAEIDHILKHHPVDKARTLLWKYRRNTPKPTWVAAAD
jgi:hypothetical protein